MSGAHRDAQLVILAPAKVNLFFELLARRDDGFHDVQTVMTTIHLCDTLAFTARHETPSIDFHAEWSSGLRARGRTSTFFGELPQDDSNLVLRALGLLQRATNTSAGANVRLVKRIPAGGGLGGGSSDAAAALMAGNTGWNLGLSRSRLRVLAAELGSDVPFFLGGTAALCTGRGEQLTPLPPFPRLHVVLVRPPESLSTGDVYRRSVVPAKPYSTPSPFIAGTIRSAANLQHILFNRLQRAAGEMSHWIPRLEQEFAKAPFVAHQMSGSGSVYFGICKSTHDAKRAQQQLRAANVGHVIRAKLGSAARVYQAGPCIN